MPDPTEPTQIPPGDAPDQHQRGSGPRPPRRPDPGSRRAALIAWTVALLAFGVVAGIQNLIPAPPPAEQAEVVTLDQHSQFSITSKLFLKLNHWAAGVDPSASGQLASQLPAVRDSAITDTERVAYAVVIAEIVGTEQALDHLETLDLSFPPESPARPLLDDLTQVYAAGSLDPGRSEIVRAELGFLGDTAVSTIDGSEIDRDALLGGGAMLAIVLFAIAGFFVLVAFASFVCCIILIVRLAGPRRKPKTFTPPAPGGSVMLETYAAFAAAFLLMIVASSVAQIFSNNQTWTMRFSFFIQWPIALVAFWPLLRGVKASDWRRLVGLHPGKGVLREIGAGIFYYLAFLPVYLASVVLMVALLFAWEIVQEAMGREPVTPTNPMFELVSGGALIDLVLLFTLATIWAPFVEETVFRGALFRHFRSRVGVIVAGVSTAIFFAFMHGYGPLFTPPLITLGVIFALMREWRGSLIAPLTAHWLHNTTALTISILVFRVLT